jgi:glycine hydroxymethyltransferase
VVTALSANAEGDAEVEGRVREEVLALCARFPIYS